MWNFMHMHRNNKHLEENDKKNEYYLQSFFIRIRYHVKSLQALTIFVSPPICSWSLRIRSVNNTDKIFETVNKLTKLQTFKQANAFTKDVFGICVPKHRSIKGPHLYTVIVLSSGNSLMISIWLKNRQNISMRYKLRKGKKN